LEKAFRNRKLLNRLANGDKSAFDEIFDHFYSRLVNFCHLLVHSYEASEDIVSNVFYQLLKNRKKATQIDNLEKYLYQAVRFQAFKYLKKSVNKGAVHYTESHKDHFIDTRSPEGDYIASELEQIMLDTVESLPPKRKQIFKMIKEDGLKYKEVASLMGISLKTVEAHLAMAVRELREKVSAYYHYDSSNTRIRKIN